MARDEAKEYGLTVKVEPGRKYVFLVFGKLREFTYTSENLPWGGFVFNIPFIYEIQYFKLVWTKVISIDFQQERNFAIKEMFNHPSHRQVERINTKQPFFNIIEYRDCLVKFDSKEKIPLYFVFNYTVQINDSLMVREVFSSGELFTQLENVLAVEIQDGVKKIPYYASTENGDELRAETFSSDKKYILDNAIEKANQMIIARQKVRGKEIAPCCQITDMTNEQMSATNVDDKIVAQVVTNEVSKLAIKEADNNAKVTTTKGEAEQALLKKQLEIENEAAVKKNNQINEADVLKADALNQQEITKQKAIITAKKQADIELIEGEAAAETKRIKDLFDICKDPGTVADIEKYNNLSSMKGLTTLVVDGSTSDRKTLEQLAALKILEDKIQNKKGDEPPTDTKK